jgi:SAM-dependent methyltransferase
MLGLALVRPLEDDWRDTLDAVARRKGWPTSRDVSQLAARVSALSAAYNDATVARAVVRDAGAARLGFAFARDVPKGAGAVRELAATGTLRLGKEPLRVLDVGAGLGATTWGLVRALDASERRGRDAPALGERPARVVEATWLDPDAQALALGQELVRERAGARPEGIELRVQSVARSMSSVGGIDGRGPFDVVLVGQVLSELDVGLSAEIRVDRHAAFLGDLLERFTHEHGSLVIVEPALRDRTRHLHRVRDLLASRGATVFAPCMHGGPCPVLAHESDWCHEDLPVDLPRWLVPVARAAGLRREGLTFSYLVVRKDGVRLAQSIPAAAVRLRVVSELIRTKGKREAFVCGELAADGEGRSVAARVRATRLDRSASAFNAPWAELRRGDVIGVDPALPLSTPRISSDSRVTPSDDTESR